MGNYLDDMAMTDEDTIKSESETPENSEPSDLNVEKEEKRGLFHRRCKNCERLEIECAEYKAGWQRALADYKNLQTEIDKRRGEWAQMSEMQILEDFLPVYEHLKKAFDHDTDTRIYADDADHADVKKLENWKVGIEHIMRQFGDVLKAHRLEEIKTVGEQLDLKFHEAVGEEESDKPAGTIIKEVDTGYVMGGRVVRAAKVIIAR